MIIKHRRLMTGNMSHDQMSHPPRCSQQYAGFMSTERPKNAYNPDCRLPTVKHVGGSVMISAAISWYYSGPIINMNSRITAIDYVDILGHQVHPMVQMLPPTMMQFLKIRPYTQPELLCLGFRSTNKFHDQYNGLASISSKHCGQFSTVR